jgi:hypothetical protein
MDNRQPRLRGHALTQHTQLMSQQHDLGFEPRLRLEWRDKDRLNLHARFQARALVVVIVIAN